MAEHDNILKRVKFVYNPSSGETAVTDCLDDIIAIYQDRGYSIIPYRLTFDRPPSEIVADLDHTYHHVLIAGGDGTVNFIINLLQSNNIDIPIAVLPAGTSNDFASMLGLPSDLIKAARSNAEGTVKPMDIGSVNGQYFVNIFSCGLFTDVSQKTPTILKNTFGKLAYYIGGVAELPKFRRMQIRITSDGGNYEGGSVIFFVFNGRSAGRFKLAPAARIDDGKLDVIIVTGENPFATIATSFRYISSASTNKYPSGVIHFQCTRLVAECDRDEITDMDGQQGPSFPLSIKCEAGRQKMIVPGLRNKRIKRG